ncbi:tyrosine-type recombinase/integrase [Nocardiopsis sp. NPDC058789]|uniref:tyrosine-type recombinase/integrase n=1 Tax=Nocardiopsis sp. NPDC058789 TaxID=3346634 RepID=UPI00366F10F8
MDHARRYAWLYTLFHLIAVKGLRRGEAFGVPWPNTRLVDGEIDILTQVVQLGCATHTCTPKSTAGKRTITLDTATVRVMRSWRRYQLEAKMALGSEWVETRLVFTQADGRGWHPAQVTDWFRRITRAAELPPITLHALRHGAASMSLAAGWMSRSSQLNSDTPRPTSPRTPTNPCSPRWPKQRPRPLPRC